MESKSISKPSRHNSQLCTNEEHLNKKLEDTQKHKNQRPNNQLLSSRGKRSFHLSNTAREHASTKVCLLNQENLIFNSRVYQECIKIYHKFASRCIIVNWGSDHLIIYDTKGKREKIKTIYQLMENDFDIECITQLPNGDLFCLGWSYGFESDCAFLIDSDFNVHKLPSRVSISFSSAIYYNRNVYCFGRRDWDVLRNLKYSSRFDLDQNRWINICSTPEYSNNCNTVIFNGNILISSENINIWLYSIDIDSFSIIPYEFNESKKVMINAEERLYLIGNGSGCWIIYESDIWDEFSWKFVLKFGNMRFIPGQAFRGIYNKKSKCIYILSLLHTEVDIERQYYKFNLNENVINEEKQKKKCRIF